MTPKLIPNGAPWEVRNCAGRQVATKSANINYNHYLPHFSHIGLSKTPLEIDETIRPHKQRPKIHKHMQNKTLKCIQKQHNAAKTIKFCKKYKNTKFQ